MRLKNVIVILLLCMKLLDVVENPGHKEVECHYSDTVHTQFHRQVTFAGVVGPLSFSGIREVIHLTVWVRIKCTGYLEGRENFIWTGKLPLLVDL